MPDPSNMRYRLTMAADQIQQAISGGELNPRTTERFADGMMELLSGYDMDSEVNVHFDQASTMTWLFGIPFTGVCEHHLMPFYGKAHVLLVPSEDDKVPGKSKYARVIEKHARRLTLEERIAEDACEELFQSDAKPAGVMVILDHVYHTCVSSRGVEAHGAFGGSCAIRGAFEDPTMRAEGMGHLARRA